MELNCNQKGNPRITKLTDPAQLHAR